MKDNTPSAGHIAQGSGILSEAIQITRCEHKLATHFVICNGQRIKFLINLHKGFKYLRKAVAPYNKKLAFLLNLLPVIPWSGLKLAQLGYFAKVSLHPSVSAAIPNNRQWNVLVGTYDDAQKLVIQCFSHQEKRCVYAKIGNAGSASQMEREIHFLQDGKNYKSFVTPNLLHSELMSDGASFNIQITDEFEGKKISTILNKDIYQIAQEIAGETILIKGEAFSFSHGDFAPWNIRKKNSTYTVFDWEHCGMRPIGYDLAYFIMISEIAFQKRSFDEAYSIAIKRIHELNPQIILDKNLIQREFIKTTKSLQF